MKNKNWLFLFALTPAVCLAQKQSTEAEDAFIQSYSAGYEHIQDENKNMIERDREMFKQGYDPNAGYGRPDKQELKQTQNQEPFLRGDSTSSFYEPRS